MAASDSTMSRAEFLALSTHLFDDMRRWLVEAGPYHNLTPDQLAVLNQAAEILEQQTLRLAAIKPD